MRKEFTACKEVLESFEGREERQGGHVTRPAPGNLCKGLPLAFGYRKYSVVIWFGILLRTFHLPNNNTRTLSSTKVT